MATRSPVCTPSSMQRVGRLAHLVLELGVGDRAGVVLGLALPVVGHLVAVTVLDVPVDAVVGDVELAADEPLRERLVRPVEDLGPLLRPGQPLGLLGPEGQPVGIGLVVGLGRDVGRPRRTPPTAGSGVLRGTGWRVLRSYFEPSSGRCRREGRPACQARASGKTGSTTFLNVELVTAANEAYQAARAVARPTQPPVLVQPCWSRRSAPMHQEARNVSASSEEHRAHRAARAQRGDDHVGGEDRPDQQVHADARG